MDIYRVSGELIRTMSLGVLPSGFHHVVWDGRTEMGTKAGSGLYCLRARIGSEVLTQKTILLR
jgi:flagellar hook assembly protein FlgD